MAANVWLPWTADSVTSASKKELVRWLQTSCCHAFLVGQRLQGAPASVAKSRSATQLRQSYSAVCAAAGSTSASVLLPKRQLLYHDESGAVGGSGEEGLLSQALACRGWTATAEPAEAQLVLRAPARAAGGGPSGGASAVSDGEHKSAPDAQRLRRAGDRCRHLEQFEAAVASYGAALALLGSDTEARRAVGETVILMAPPCTCIRFFNRDTQRVVIKMTVSPTARRGCRHAHGRA